MLDCRKTGGAAFNQKAADAVVGSRPDDRDVSYRTVGDPRLFAVENPVGSISNGPCSHPGRVGPEVGFGQTETADRPPLPEIGDPAFLLFEAAPLEDRVHDERGLHRNEGAETGISPFELAVDESVGDRGDSREVEVGIR